MTVTERILAAIRAGDRGEALGWLVNQLAAEGHTKAAIVDSLNTTREQQIRADVWQETDEDRFVDVMDGLYGWCLPSGWLLPDQEPYPLGEAPAEPGSHKTD